MSEHDLSTPDGFAAMMREKEAEAGAAPPEQPFDPFNEVAEPEPPPEEEQPEEEPEAEEAPAGPQPEDQALTEAEERGYLRALGEQSERLGEERARREAAEAYIEQQLQGEEPTPEPITESTWEHLESLYETQGGAGMMLALANEPNVTEDLIDAGIALWKENDYRNAELYEKRVARMTAASTPEPEQQSDPAVAQLVSEQANSKAVSILTSEFGREKLEALQPYLEPAMKQMPSRLQDALGEDFQSADPERIVSAFRTLAALAEPQVEGPTKAAAKVAAGVGGGSQSRVSSGESELPSTREELEGLGPPDSPERKLAAKKIMGARIIAQQTSVAQELAKNKQQ